MISHWDDFQAKKNQNTNMFSDACVLFFFFFFDRRVHKHSVTFMFGPLAP